MHTFEVNCREKSMSSSLNYRENQGKFVGLAYNTRQKSWDTLHIFNLDKTFVPRLPLNNVGFWEKYMGNGKFFRVQ